MLASWIYLSLLEKSDCGLFLANGAIISFILSFLMFLFLCVALWGH